LVDHLHGNLTEPFNISIVPRMTVIKEDSSSDSLLISNVHKAPKSTREEESAERLSQIPGLHRLGPIHKTCSAVQLTESETEYTVQCFKHIFANYVVFQFDCLNTLPDQLLENVRVELTIPEGFTARAQIPCQKLQYNSMGSTYTLVEFPPNVANSVGAFGATLRFVVKDCDPVTGLPDSDDGYDDEYMLEDLEVTVADQIQRLKKNKFFCSMGFC